MIRVIGSQAIYGIPINLLLLLVLAVIVGVMLQRTAFGRKIYMVGGNPRAAELVGINVGRVTFSCYVLSSILAALGGLVLVGYVGSVDNWVGRGYELNSIIATVMGGVSLGGGRGTVFGALVGRVRPDRDIQHRPASGLSRAVSVGGEGRCHTPGGGRISRRLSFALAPTPGCLAGQRSSGPERPSWGSLSMAMNWISTRACLIVASMVCLPCSAQTSARSSRNAFENRWRTPGGLPAAFAD